MGGLRKHGGAGGLIGRERRMVVAVLFGLNYTRMCRQVVTRFLSKVCPKGSSFSKA